MLFAACSKRASTPFSRVICETGEALTDYMDREFRDLPCARIELDEQWQFVGIHSGGC